MNSKILILAFVACYQVAVAQGPSGFPNPFNIGGFPSLGGLGGLGSSGSSFNTNWVRPYYTAAADGWRTYFEQLQQARTQLYQTLTNLQNTAQNASGTARDTLTQILSAMPIHTKHIDDDDDDEKQPQILGDLQTPTVEAPTQHDAPHEIQVVHTVTRPQVQSDAPHVRPQGQVTVTHTVTQSQPNARQPQTQTNARQPQPTAAHQTVTTATRPVTSQVTSGTPQVGSQIVPQVGSQIVPQVGSQIVPQVGAQLIPQEGFQVPTWVGK